LRKPRLFAASLAPGPARLQAGFWGGFLPLWATAGIGQLVPQIDIVMAARTGVGAPSAYALLLRVAVLDTVAALALAAVASVVVVQAHRAGRTAEVLGHLVTFALVSGTCFGALGLCLYPRLVGALAGDREIAALAASGIAWFAAAAPFRAFSGMAGLALHGLGSGSYVLRWRTAELVSRTIGNLLLVDVLGTGFPGLFISGFVVSVLSSAWLWHRLANHGLQRPRVPNMTFSGSILRAAGSEAQRLLSAQMAVAVALVLFSTAWLGAFDGLRLDAYAAGQTLILFVLAPLAALTRYLAFRLAPLPESERTALVQLVRRSGQAFAIGAATILFVGAEWLGHAIYGQHGPWWSVLVQALALSLPLRYAGSVTRAALQARGAFSTVAAADSVATWFAAVPLVGLGLWLECPAIAYSSLVLPEGLCLAWLARKLSSSSYFTTA